MKITKPKLKTYRYLKITIDVEQEIKKTPVGEERTDKFFFVDILYPEGGGIEFAEPIGKDYGKSLRKTFKRIIDELHLKN